MLSLAGRVTAICVRSPTRPARARSKSSDSGLAACITGSSSSSSSPVAMIRLKSRRITRSALLAAVSDVAAAASGGGGGGGGAQRSEAAGSVEGAADLSTLSSCIPLLRSSLAFAHAAAACNASFPRDAAARVLCRAPRAASPAREYASFAAGDTRCLASLSAAPASRAAAEAEAEASAPTAAALLFAR